MGSPIRTSLVHASCTVSNHPAPTAASVAAPCAAPSAVEVVTIAAPSTSARIRRHRSLLLPPPVALIWLAGGTPAARISSSESRRPNATPSSTARVR